MGFQKKMNMILNNFHGMNSLALLHANIIEDQLAILFNKLVVGYLVYPLRHKHDVVVYLTIAMAKTMQFHYISHPSHRFWVAPPVAKVPKQPIFKRSYGLSI